MLAYENRHLARNYNPQAISGFRFLWILYIIQLSNRLSDLILRGNIALHNISGRVCHLH